MAIALKNMKKCGRCEMVGMMESLGDLFCKNCELIEKLEKSNALQEQRIAKLEKRLEELMGIRVVEEQENIKKYNEQRACMTQMEQRMEKIKTTEVTESKGSEEEKVQAWSEIVKKKLDEELKVVTQKVKTVEKRIELQVEEDKLKERKKNNIIIHRLAESQETDEKARNTEDRRTVTHLMNDILKVPMEEKVDIKRIFRLGKLTEGEKQRPLLVEFKDGTMKNKVLENLSKLREAGEKLRQISVAHDMTENERGQCRELVKECREKQKKEESGEWKYQVRGTPGDMRVVKTRKF